MTSAAFDTVLGIETSGSWCSAALLHGSEVCARRADVGNAHTDHLLKMIDDVLAEAGVALSDCGAIAFSAGPGSFTGLRVACAVAQGLAFGASLEVAPVGTLDAIAMWGLSAVYGDGRVDRASMLVAQDARIGEVYWCLMAIEPDRGIRTVVGPALASPAQLRETLRATRGDRPIEIGCGNAWAVHGDAMRGLVERVVERKAADAVEIAHLGRIALLSGHLVPAKDASPLYVRNEVARTTAERDEQAARAARAAEALQAAAP